MKVTHEAMAGRLRQAYTGEQVAPLRDGLVTTDAKGAYGVQLLNTRYWQAEGRRVVGRKVGLTAKSVQQQLGVDQPDFGVLFEDMRIPDRGQLVASKMHQPKVEAEVALVLKADLANPDLTTIDVMAAMDYAVAAIEIVDSRIVDWQITLADTVADNGSAAFYVLGADRRSLSGLDLYSCGMVLEINGEVASVGAGAACFGHPLNAAEWLARTVVANGEPLRAGDVILTGSLGPMIALTPGDHVTALIGGLGKASFTYVEDR